MLLLVMSQRPAYNSTYVGCLALLYLTLTEFYIKKNVGIVIIFLILEDVCFNCFNTSCIFIFTRIKWRI